MKINTCLNLHSIHLIEYKKKIEQILISYRFCCHYLSNIIQHVIKRFKPRIKTKISTIKHRKKSFRFILYLIIHKQVASRFDLRQYPKRNNVPVESSTTNAKCSPCSSLKLIYSFIEFNSIFRILRRYFAWICKARRCFKTFICIISWIFS